MQVYNQFEQSTGKITISKGNQVKMNLDGKWYKADFLGYEGASEFVASHLIRQSNITEYVDYQLKDITINDKMFHGCVSDDFLKEGEELCTAYRLFLSFTGEDISETLAGMSLKDKITYFVTTVEKITGIPDFGKTLTLMLEWDRFIFNEDRHFNNIAFIKSESGFRLAPFFDNGAAFLSDTREDYPLNKNVHGLMLNVDAKPFSEDFDKQVDMCISLYGSQLKLSKTLSLPEDVLSAVSAMYDESVSKRIQTIFEHQIYNYREYLSMDIIDPAREDMDYDDLE